jgi:hypothetical protein
VRLNPASLPDSYSLLYLYKGPNEATISDRASIEIDRLHHRHVFTERYIGNRCMADFWLRHDSVAWNPSHKCCSRLAVSRRFSDIAACGHGDTAPWLQQRIFMRWLVVPGHERADALKNKERDSCRAARRVSQKLPCYQFVRRNELLRRSVSYAVRRFLPTFAHCNSSSTRRRP